jgi:hypothetical protein
LIHNLDTGNAIMLDQKGSELPVYLYVVTAQRTRAGKPPIKIAPIAIKNEPIGYRYAGDNPVWVTTASTRGGCASDKLFPLDECYETPQLAVEAMNKLIDSVVSYEQEKLARLKKKFTEARGAAKKLIKES